MAALIRTLLGTSFVVVLSTVPAMEASILIFFCALRTSSKSPAFVTCLLALLRVVIPTTLVVGDVAGDEDVLYLT